MTAHKKKSKSVESAAQTAAREQLARHVHKVKSKDKSKQQSLEEGLAGWLEELASLESQTFESFDAAISTIAEMVTKRYGEALDATGREDLQQFILVALESDPELRSSLASFVKSSL